MLEECDVQIQDWLFRYLLQSSASHLLLILMRTTATRTMTETGSRLFIFVKVYYFLLFFKDRQWTTGEIEGQQNGVVEAQIHRDRNI